MDTTRPIRALMRGLDAVCALNARDGATVADVVHDTHLPRTTVYRVLETLREAGLVYRDPLDERYRLTGLVRGLSDGFDEDAWLARAAQPHLAELSASLGWPAAVATPSGARMLLREAGGRGAAHRVPLAASAAGFAYLAHLPPAQRAVIAAALTRHARAAERAPADFDRLLDEVRAQGYAAAPAAPCARQSADALDISVPISVGGRALAALNLRFDAQPASPVSAADRFLAKLRACAREIRDDFLKKQVGARRKDSPAPAS